MRAAVTERRETMRVRTVPEPPEPRGGEVLVRPEAVGLCGSDFRYFLGAGDESRRYPRIQGLEAAGIVEAIGSDCAGLRIGERVALLPVAACGSRSTCLGIHRDGALQERLLLPAAQVLPVGERDASVAALIEPV